jgi:hypothetical protein
MTPEPMHDLPGEQHVQPVFAGEQREQVSRLLNGADELPPRLGVGRGVPGESIVE